MRRQNQLITRTARASSTFFIITFDMEKETLLPTRDDRPLQLTHIDKDIVHPRHHRSRCRRLFAIAFTAVAFLYLCFSIARPFLHTKPLVNRIQPTPLVLDQPAETTKSLIPLEAHIMSKCPDAKVKFFFPAMISSCQLIVLGMFEGVGAPNHATNK
jgi:hypothetical protein